ncbi:hypothetical protein EGW08_014776, partial [Elysia chlorotica]
FFVDINAAAGEKTEKEFQEKYGADSVKFQVADITDFTKFEGEYITDFSKFEGEYITDFSKFEGEHFCTNQSATTTLVKGTLMATEHMRKDKGGNGGRIINVSSDAGLEIPLLAPVYAGTKHAVRAFTSCLSIAPDLPEQDIEYGVLCPCPAATDMFMNIDNEKVRHLHTLRPEVKKVITAPIECITRGFLKLVSLDQMNGAILYACQTEMTFRRMDNVGVGATWPTGEPPKKMLFDQMYEDIVAQGEAK